MSVFRRFDELIQRFEPQRAMRIDIYATLLRAVSDAKKAGISRVDLGQRVGEYIDAIYDDSTSNED